MSANALLNVLESIKWVFVGAYVLSTIGVTVGVYWEGDQFPKEKQHRGWRLLICCLAADTFFTIMVFGIEGWVGHIQRNEIIALEARLAPRILTSEQQSTFVSRLKSLPEQEYALSVAVGNEPANLLCTLDALFQTLHWRRVGPFGTMIVDTHCVGTGLNATSGVQVRAPTQETLSVARAIAAELTADSITTITALDTDHIPSKTAILVIVGIKE